MRESVIAAELADWPAVLHRQLLGGADARSIETELERLGSVRCFFFEGSVGALFGVELADGQRVALKLHQEHVAAGRLRAVQTVQAHLVAHRYPCPRPLLPPVSVLGRLATGEEWRDDGEYALPDDRRTPVLAQLLARQIELCKDLPAANVLSWVPSDDRLWPRPHNALFDFDATMAGAEWIDEIARAAKTRNRAGPRALAHQDFTCRHVRWNGDAPTVVYDWDSVSCDNESIAVGNSAATHTAPHGEFLNWAPDVAGAVAFLDAYEEARPLAPETRRAAEAQTVYSVAYTARCEHSGGTEPITGARAVLRDFAERFL